MVRLETDRQDVIETTRSDRFDFDRRNMGKFRVVDDINAIVAFTVRRSFGEESAQILQELAENTAEGAGEGVDLLAPRENLGYGVSVLDVKDAKYVFGVAEADGATALASVGELLDELPRNLDIQLGYGLVLGIPDIKSRQRYMGLSLDLQTRRQLMLERAAICKAIGVNAVGFLSPHVSLLSVKGSYDQAEQSAEILGRAAGEIDHYIESSGDPSLRLELGEPELREIGLEKL